MEIKRLKFNLSVWLHPDRQKKNEKERLRNLPWKKEREKERKRERERKKERKKGRKEKAKKLIPLRFAILLGVTRDVNSDKIINLALARAVDTRFVRDLQNYRL